MFFAPCFGIYIGVHQIAAQRIPARWQRRSSGEDSDDGRRVALSLESSAALEMRLGELMASASGRSARLHVVLADAHCRFLAMPRPAGARTPRELQLALAARFNAVFAEEEPHWSIVTPCAPSSDIDLVVGTRSELLTRLRTFCETHRFRLASVRPSWIAWARRWQAHLRRGDHWLVCANEGWTAVGYLSAGRCRHLRLVRTLDNCVPLASLIAREQALFPHASPQAAIWTSGIARASSGGGTPLTQASSEDLWCQPDTIGVTLWSEGRPA